ncbi:MAG: DMT family transporter [Eubacteriales bacterium]
MNNQKKVLKVTGVLMALLSCALWGSAVPFVKAMYGCFGVSSQEIGNQFFLAGIRFALAGIIIILYVSYRQRKFAAVERREVKCILHVAAYQTVFQYMFYYIGIANTASVVASIIVGSTAFFSFLLSCFFYKQEKFAWSKLAGCILGFSGILLCLGNGSLDAIDFKLMGAGSSLIAAIFYALSSCLLKKYAGFMDSVKLCGYQFFAGGIVLCIVSVFVGINIPEVTISGIMCVLYLAMVSAVAYSMWSVLLSKYNVSQITIFTFSTPMFGTVFSCMFDRSELSNLSHYTVIALLLVIMGIVIINKETRKKRG